MEHVKTVIGPYTGTTYKLVRQANGIYRLESMVADASFTNLVTAYKFILDKEVRLAMGKELDLIKVA